LHIYVSGWAVRDKLMINAKNEPADWPQRSWALALTGAAIGLLVHLLLEDGTTKEIWRISLATVFVVAGVAMAFVVERGRLVPSAIFAGCAAIIIGFTLYWNGGPEGLSNSEGWRLACAALAVAIAAPLLQAWGDAGMPRPPRLAQLAYPDLHDRAWMNVVLWCACWLFTGVVWLLIYLIGQLFALIGIDAIKDLMRESWFGMMLTGGAFGAAAGLMRDRERILMTLQTVVRRVLSVLAPILGAALVLFLASMLVTGLSPLWEATKSTTPIVISAAIVAIILANAAIGDSPEDEAKMPLIRWGAMALGGTLLPLGIIAAISTGLRITQYGLTPDRLWAIVFGGIACAYGLAYLVALIRKRDGWMADIRPANVRLAIGLCALAFVLAMPVINFGAWSTASQLARLESGKVTAEKFDWVAMRFDFGASGQAAVERLAKSGKTPAIRLAAAKALKLENRWEGGNEIQVATRAEQFKKRVKILPVTVPIPDALGTAIARNNDCEGSARCVLLYNAGASEAVQVVQSCETCNMFTTRYVLRDGDWKNAPDFSGNGKPDGDAERRTRAKQLGEGKVSIREVKHRQVFVGDDAVGDVFE
jgi:Domain of unknown function (DUF4153)